MAVLHNNNRNIIHMQHDLHIHVTFHLSTSCEISQTPVSSLLYHFRQICLPHLFFFELNECFSRSVLLQSLSDRLGPPEYIIKSRERRLEHMQDDHQFVR